MNLRTFFCALAMMVVASVPQPTRAESLPFEFPAWTTAIAPALSQLHQFGAVAANSLRSAAAVQRSLADKRNLPNPELSLAIAGMPTSFDPTSVAMTQAPLIGISQRLPNRRAARDQARAANAQSQEFAEMSSQRFEQYALHLATALFEHHFLVQKARLLALQKRQYRNQIDSFNTQYRTGASYGFERHALDAEIGLLDIEIQEIERQKQVAKLRWKEITSIAMPQLGDDHHQMESTKLPTSNTVAKQTPQVQALERKAQQLAHRAAAERHSGGAQWKFGINYGLRHGGREDLLGLSIGTSLPLFRRASVLPKARALEFESQAVQAQAQQVLQSTTAKLEAHAESVASYQGQWKQITTKVLPIAQQARDSAQSAYQSGHESIATVVQAANRALSIEIKALYILTQMHIHHAQWMAAAGYFQEMTR